MKERYTKRNKKNHTVDKAKQELRVQKDKRVLQYQKWCNVLNLQRVAFSIEKDLKQGGVWSGRHHHRKQAESSKPLCRPEEFAPSIH